MKIENNCISKKEVLDINDRQVVIIDVRGKEEYESQHIANAKHVPLDQLNNVLVFPGIFKGAFEANATKITDDMKIAAAEALAALVEKPTKEKIIPSPFDEGVADAVAQAVVSKS